LAEIKEGFEGKEKIRNLRRLKLMSCRKGTWKDILLREKEPSSSLERCGGAQGRKLAAGDPTGMMQLVHSSPQVSENRVGRNQPYSIVQGDKDH